jgi:hypothetical protein
LACVMLWRRFHRVRRQPRKGTRTGRPAPWHALSAQHFRPVTVSASMIACCRAAVRSWVQPGSAAENHSSRPNGSARTWTAPGAGNVMRRPRPPS